jgi:hypothetical protein
MPDYMPRLTTLRLLPLAAVVACATAGSPVPNAGANSPQYGRESSGVNPANDIRLSPNDAPCTECGAVPMATDVTHAIESRLEVLKARGGDCSRYAAVLEQSYRGGRITLRPYMWRVGRSLTSGEAKPNGDMTLAREIDSLNVGVRTVDDVLFSMEHEAVHITFALASGDEASEDKANRIVRGCQA